jgi:5-methylcytosine-specific restriction endonuclease McrA
MDIKDKQKYQQKANDSFITKKNLYLFNKIISTDQQNINLADFKNFVINKDLVNEYTTKYWQYEPEFELRPGLTNDSIQKLISSIEKEKKLEIESFRLDYIANIFPTKYPANQFEKLIHSEECSYCGITIEMVTDLANKQQLYKKNYRGWSLEIDRKNSNFEYAPENCVMACYWCNNAKTDEFTYDEFKEIGHAIRQIWEKRMKIDNS